MTEGGCSRSVGFRPTMALSLESRLAAMPAHALQPWAACRAQHTPAGANALRVLVALLIRALGRWTSPGERSREVPAVPSASGRWASRASYDQREASDGGHAGHARVPRRRRHRDGLAFPARERWRARAGR